MKYKYIIFLAVIFFIACETDKMTYSIKGNLGADIQVDSVFIYVEEQIVAKAPVKAGKFELKGSVSEPCNAGIGTRERKIGEIILENADYTCTYADGRVRVKGGLIHDLVLGFESGDEYLDAVSEYENTLNVIFSDENKDNDDITPEENKRINDKAEAVIVIENRNLNKVIDDPNAPLLAKAFAVSRTQEWEKYSLEKRVSLLKDYQKELGESETVAGLLALWEDMMAVEASKASVEAGQMFKDVEALDVNGNVIKLSDVIAKNKFTILEFWASWCGPCRGEIPNLKKAYAKYHPKGLEIYAISLDNNNDKWLKALKEEDTPWLNVVDKAAFKGKGVKDYAVSGVPASFLIGQDGKILASDNGLRGKELEQTLSQYMP